MTRPKKNKPDNNQKKYPLNDKELIRKKSKVKNHPGLKPPEVSEQ